MSKEHTEGKWHIQKWPEWLRVSYLDNLNAIKEIETKVEKLEHRKKYLTAERETLLEQIEAWWAIKQAERTYIGD